MGIYESCKADVRKEQRESFDPDKSPPTHLIIHVLKIVPFRK